MKNGSVRLQTEFRKRVIADLSVEIQTGRAGVTFALSVSAIVNNQDCRSGGVDSLRVINPVSDVPGRTG